MKFAVVTGRYAFSGVPLAQLRMARALEQAHHSVDFLIGNVNRGFLAPVLERGRVINFGCDRVSHTLPALVRYLRDSQPDVVFSAGDHLNAVVLLAAIISGSKAKVSCSSRVTPLDTYSRRLFTKGWILKYLMKLLSWRAQVESCVSEDMVEQYKDFFPTGKHRRIYNIVIDASFQERMMAPLLKDEAWFNGDKTFIAAGNIEPWKGFTDLIFAYARVREVLPDSRLIILGDGSQMGLLQEQVRGLGLVERVHLPGNVANPLSYFSRSDVFVLSSKVEGLPNVLVEGMACGCTPVATDCPTGPREVLQDGQFGYLVPVGDINALADGMIQAAQRPIATEILRRAVESFEEEPVLRHHFKLLGLEF